MGFWDKVAGVFGGRQSFAPCGVEGERAYVIGDIHGRRDLLDDLLARIDADRAAAAPRRDVIVFLGDYIDRGPDSAGVLERLANYAPAGAGIVFLGGNHEEALRRVLDGQPGVLGNWLRFGGGACAESYGIDEDELRQAGDRQAGSLLAQHIPKDHLRFLNTLEDAYLFGDYFLVHAGIRPGVPLEQQAIQDLRWIREPFLDHAGHHGVMVVHGHTIVETAQEHANRIALDTGAYRTGVLTALVIEDDRRRFLATDAGS